MARFLIFYIFACFSATYASAISSTSTTPPTTALSTLMAPSGGPISSEQPQAQPGVSEQLLITEPEVSISNTTSDPLSPPPQESLSDPITVWAILGAVLVLFLSCITHPLGSSCGFPHEFHYCIRAAPLVALYDSLLLIFEVFYSCRVSGVQDAIDRAVTNRLGDNVGNTTDLKSLSYTLLLDIRTRLIVMILCILQYTKLCGYHGIPFTFFTCTIFFASWLIMEVAFFLTAFRPISRYERSLTPEPRRIFPSIVVSVFLLVIQVIPLFLFIVCLEVGGDYPIWYWYLWFVVVVPAEMVGQVIVDWWDTILRWFGILPSEYLTSSTQPVTILMWLLYLPVIAITIIVMSFWIFGLGLGLPSGVVALVGHFCIEDYRWRGAVVTGITVAGGVGIGLWCIFGFDQAGTTVEAWASYIP